MIALFLALCSFTVQDAPAAQKPATRSPTEVQDAQDKVATEPANPAAQVPQNPAAAPARQLGFAGTPAGKRPMCEIAWNRLYPTDELYALFDKLQATFPGLMSMQVIGHSIEGREMRVYTINQPSTGKDTEKPAMWIDGNVHGNEVQCGEAVLYTAWYLLENYRSNAQVTKLVEDDVFYLCPTQNPDGRAAWFRDANSAHSSRGGRQPHDDDGDGLADEDGPDDLDGDGNITQMWKKVPGRGTFRQDPDDPRLFEPVPQNDKGIRGDWIPLGEEGIDNDGDGRINEDPPGGYDMNRAWPSMWAPEFVQYGAGPYPLSWPETRSIARFILDHPKIAALQSFHNAGGMILRGPGAKDFGEYPSEDVAVFDRLGREGEKMLPFYRYMVIWRDLYTVWGGFATWGYEGLGIISFTNEMWTDERLYPSKQGGDGSKDRMFFSDALMMGDAFVPYHAYKHPLYGDIVIGGFKKDFGRVPPSFMIEEEAHRNALFCLKHAAAMPKLQIEKLTVTALGDGLRAVDASFRNLHPIPTRTARSAQMKIGKPDIFAIRGKSLEVLAGGFRSDEFRPEQIALAERDPSRLVSDRGIPGESTVMVRWIVRGTGTVTVEWHGEKARAVSRDVELK